MPSRHFASVFYYTLKPGHQNPNQLVEELMSLISTKTKQWKHIFILYGQEIRK